MNDKYEFMEKDDYHGFLQSKHIKLNEKIANTLWQALENSKYTKGELAERLGWDLHNLMMVMAADTTIDTHDMVHVAGALGLEFELKLVPIENPIFSVGEVKDELVDTIEVDSWWIYNVDESRVQIYSVDNNTVCFYGDDGKYGELDGATFLDLFSFFKVGEAW